MEPNPELSEPATIFTCEDIKLCCSLVLKPTLCDDYLTQMPAPLRMHRYQYKLNPRTSYMIDGLRYEYGIDVVVNQLMARQCYSLAEKNFSLIGCCKLIATELATQTKDPELKRQLNYDELAYRWILNGCTVFDDTRLDFWDDVLKNQSKLVEKVQELLRRKQKESPKDLEIEFMVQFFESKNKKTEEDILPPLTKLRELAVVHQHLPAAHYILYLLYYARLSNQLPQFTAQCEQYITILRANKYYHSYADCAKTLNKLKRHRETMDILREGTREGYEVCMTWLLCGIYSYEYKQIHALKEVMEIYAQVCLLQDTYWYEFLYSRVLSKKGYFIDVPTGDREKHYQELEDQFVKAVLETNQRSLETPKLQDEFGLILHYYLPDMPLQTKDELLTDLVNKAFKEDRNQRLYMCFLMKTRRRMLREAIKQSDMANIEAKRKHLRNAEEKFMKFCRQRGNNTDSSTAFFRLGRCFEKGYGVDADIVQAYILYCKSLEQISIKHDVAFNTSVTIYHCRQRCRRKLKIMADNPQVVNFRKQVASKAHEEECCGVCWQQGYDAVLYPCQHLTCTSCYSKYKDVSDTCPLCRAKIIACLNAKWILELSEMLANV